MTVTEKAAYIKGLAEGLSLDADKPEVKVINAIIDLLDDIAMTAADLEDEVALIGEQVDAIDEDLDDLEEYVYEDEEFDENDYFEVECPSCGEIICLDEGILEEGSIECPNCNESLEFDFECDCDDCRED